jgi:hypothetical protein
VRSNFVFSTDSVSELYGQMMYKYFLLLISHFIASIPVATRSKAWVCGRSLAGSVGSNSTGANGCLFVVNVVCCQVQVSATGRSLVQRSPTDCDASLCVIQKPQE